MKVNSSMPRGSAPISRPAKASCHGTNIRRKFSNALATRGLWPFARSEHGVGRRSDELGIYYKGIYFI